MKAAKQLSAQIIIPDSIFPYNYLGELYVFQIGNTGGAGQFFDENNISQYRLYHGNMGIDGAYVLLLIDEKIYFWGTPRALDTFKYENIVPQNWTSNPTY